MQQLIFLVLAAGIGLAIFKLRGGAAKERKAVMSRLADERDARGGDYSPTAELFREAGVPMVTTANGAPTFERLSDLAPAGPGADPWQVPPRDEAFLPDPAATAPAEPLAEPEPEPELDDLPAPTGAPALHEMPAPPAAIDDEPVGDIRVLLRGIAMPAGLRPFGPLAPSDASFVTSASPTEVHDGLDAEFERLGCRHDWVTAHVAEVERHGERGVVTIYPDAAAALGDDGFPIYDDLTPGQVVVRMLGR